MQSINSSASFPSIQNAAQAPQVVPLDFTTPVTQAVAILTGFNVQFTRSDGDHHFGLLNVRLTTAPPSGTSVVVTVDFDLRDWSGSHDDKYQGEVQFAVVGE